MTAEAEELITLDEVASAGRTALYRLYNAAAEVIYIGISDDPVGRMYGHAREQPWWDEVAGKTAVWYQTRAAAEVAETIAIGLEQPKYNKAKRYVRLPEQPFPIQDRAISQSRPRPAPVVRPVSAPGRPEPRLPEIILPHFRGDHSPESRNPNFPPDWPGNLWCLSFYYGTRGDDGLGFEDFMRSRGGGCWESADDGRRRPPPLEHLYARAHARNSRWSGVDSYVQPGAGGTWIACAGRFADHDGDEDGVGPDDPAWEDQRRFVFALKRAGRCTSFQLGRSAWAAGIGDAGEARMVALVFQMQKYRNREYALRAIACLEARYRAATLRRNGWRWPCDRHDIRRPRRNGTFTPAPTRHCTCWSDCHEHPECIEEGSSA